MKITYNVGNKTALAEPVLIVRFVQYAKRNQNCVGILLWKLIWPPLLSFGLLTQWRVIKQEYQGCIAISLSD